MELLAPTVTHVAESSSEGKVGRTRTTTLTREPGIFFKDV